MPGIGSDPDGYGGVVNVPIPVTIAWRGSSVGLPTGNIGGLCCPQPPSLGSRQPLERFTCSPDLPMAAN